MIAINLRQKRYGPIIDELIARVNIITWKFIVTLRVNQKGQKSLKNTDFNQLENYSKWYVLTLDHIYF